MFCGVSFLLRLFQVIGYWVLCLLLPSLCHTLSATSHLIPCHQPIRPPVPGPPVLVIGVLGGGTCITRWSVGAYLVRVLRPHGQYVHVNIGVGGGESNVREYNIVSNARS